MIGIFIDVLMISFYMSVLIIIILSLKKKLFDKYTEIFKYILCIGITLRLIFITRISIPMPEILKKFEYINDKTILDYMANIATQSNIGIDLLEISCCVWIIGMIVSSIYYIQKQRNFYRNIGKLKIYIIENDIYNILENQKNDLNIKRNIKVSKLDGIHSPMIVGIINPEIIIPNRNYTYNNLKYIFRHELIHHKRKDNLLKLILMVVSIIHWFNPAIYLFRKYFLDQCELSCDELTTKNFTINESKEYSLLLLDTIKYKNKLNSQMCVSYLNTYKSNLTKDRIENILSNKNYKRCTSSAILLGLAILTSTVSFHKEIISFVPASSEKTSYYNSEIIVEFVDNEGRYNKN
ncbi:MAG: M56 family metallopeptidase [Peptostreptococcaceae bacterium]